MSPSALSFREKNKIKMLCYFYGSQRNKSLSLKEQTPGSERSCVSLEEMPAVAVQPLRMKERLSRGVLRIKLRPPPRPSPYPGGLPARRLSSARWSRSSAPQRRYPGPGCYRCKQMGARAQSRGAVCFFSTCVECHFS